MRVAAIALLAALAFASRPAAAADCAAAEGPVAQAICADPALKQADDRLRAAYVDLRARLAPEAASILDTQWAGWDRSREACSLAAGPEPYKACLLQRTLEIVRMLEGAPETALEGAPLFHPVVAGRIDRGESLLIALLYPQAAGDAVADLNAAIAGAANGDDRALTAKRRFILMVSYRIPYASADFVSVVLKVFALDLSRSSDQLRVHETAINWLPAAAGPLADADLVAPDKLDEATAYCRDELAKSWALDPPPDEEVVAANLTRGDKWQVDANGAAVLYDADDIAIGRDVTARCLLPWARLRDLVPEGSHLPFPPE